MAIVDNTRRKLFQDCTSFKELGSLCNKYSYLYDRLADEIRNKIYSLPAEFDESFIKFLIKCYRLDNDYTEDNARGTYVSLLRDYSNKIVNAGILKEVTINSKYIPIIVYSAFDHNQINIHYLMNSVGIITFKDCMKLFYEHDYNLLSGVPQGKESDSTLNVDSEYAAYLRAVDILTSQSAYEDFIYQFSTKIDREEGNEYLFLRSEKIYNQYILMNKCIVDSKEIEVMDIYYFLTYLITTIERNQDYLNSTSQRFIFEKAIREIYESIDQIILHIPVKLVNQPKEVSTGDYKVFAEIKRKIIDAIIDEAFLYMYRYQNQLNKQEDIKKYFDIRVDTNGDHYDCLYIDYKIPGVFCYRVIPDTPTMILDKDNSPIATEAYDRNSSKMDAASRKIYKGYKAYKDAENKVDSQITKLCSRIKNVFTGNKTARDKIIEGEQFSAIKILKKLLTTAAIFSFSKIAGVLFIIVKHYCSKAVTNKERKRLIGELELEIKMLDEKIEDARGDGNRQAKYNMMRTRAELQKALEQIKYGLTASEKAMKTAKAVMHGKTDLDYNGPDQNTDED